MLRLGVGTGLADRHGVGCSFPIFGFPLLAPFSPHRLLHSVRGPSSEEQRRSIELDVKTLFLLVVF